MMVAMTDLGWRLAWKAWYYLVRLAVDGSNLVEERGSGWQKW
jgi:hypothetical protein